MPAIQYSIVQFVQYSTDTMLYLGAEWGQVIQVAGKYSVHGGLITRHGGTQSADYRIS